MTSAAPYPSRPSPHTVTIGRATPGDAGEILRLLIKVYSAFLSDFRPTALTFSVEDIRDDCAHWVVCRSDEGALCGVAKAWVEFGYYTFCFLSVPPGSRKNGVGSAMINFMLQEAKALGVSQCRIVLRRTLATNIDYFTKRGFTRAEPFGTGNHDFYVMHIEDSANGPCSDAASP